MTGQQKRDGPVALLVGPGLPFDGCVVGDHHHSRVGDGRTLHIGDAAA